MGSAPTGSLCLFGSKFYGMTNQGGSANKGVIFEWDPVTNIYTKKIKEMMCSLKTNHFSMQTYI